jgi:DDE superfamily endonuclease
LAGAPSGAFSRLTTSPSKKSLHAAEQQRPDVVEARRAFIRRQPALDPERLVFLDETSATMTRRLGRCALRLLAPVPHGHWKTTTLVAGLRTTGITAPYVLDGAVTGDIFRAYVEQILAPTLSPGDIVVMDNLPCHKVAGVQEAIGSRGAQLLRPTALISTRSNRLSPNSKRCSERSPNAPVTAFGTPLDRSSSSTAQTSAETSSGIPAIQPDRTLL